MPDDFGCTCLSCVPFLFSPQACGCGQRPAFPAPSSIPKGARFKRKIRARSAPRQREAVSVRAFSYVAFRFPAALIDEWRERLIRREREHDGRTFRRADHRRRPVRHRRRLSSADEMSVARALSSSKAATPSAAPGICSAIPASAPTATCSRSAIPSSRGPSRRRSPTARASSTTCARPRPRTASTGRSAYHHRVKRASWSTPDARWTVEAERISGRGRDRDRDLHLQLPVLLRRLLQIRGRLHAGVQGHGRFRRPDRPSAEMARGPRLRRQARGRDRLGRHRGDAGAGDGQDRGSCHHAAALADLCGVAPGAGCARQQAAAQAAGQDSPIT